MRLRLSVSIILVLLTAACQAASTPAPTTTPLPPTATSTASPVPPTATPTAAPPTATPTATPPPTVTASPLPPIATANFAPGDIVGTWYRFDQARGNLFLTFADDGSYDAAHGNLEGSVHHGDYTLEGRLITIIDGWNCSPAETTPGQYTLRLIGGGNWLYFDLYLDSCPDRPESLTGFRWDRYVAP
jgi:hypothetical protein